MARIRSVHPDMCVSETMVDLRAELERTFVRLWTHCDDEGRCIDSPLLIKAAIYPLHVDMNPDKVDGELEELAWAGLLWRYEVGGKKYLQVRSWDEYQHPQRPRKSKFPLCPRSFRDMYANKHGSSMEGTWTGGEREAVCADEYATDALNPVTDIKAKLAEKTGS